MRIYAYLCDRYCTPLKAVVFKGGGGGGGGVQVFHFDKILFRVRSLRGRSGNVPTY